MRRYPQAMHRTLRAVVLVASSIGLALAAGCECTSELVTWPGDGGSVVGGTGGVGGSLAGTGGTAGTGFQPGGYGGSDGGSAPGGSNVGGVDEECLYVPEPGEFSPEMDCSWNGAGGGQPYAVLDDVVMTPVVINLTDDNDDGVVDTDDIPDIAFVSYQRQSSPCPSYVSYCGCCNADGALRVVSGGCQPDGTMVEHFTVGGDETEAQIGQRVWLDNSGGLAVGDIDADGEVDIVATVNRGGTIAFERDGAVKWYQPLHPDGADHVSGTAPSIADLDSDGMPEIVQGRVVLSGLDGAFLWQGQDHRGSNCLGPVSAVGDIDLDGYSNVLAGGTLYDHEGNTLWSYGGYPSHNCCSSPCDGFAATGNFDADLEGEVAVVRDGTLYFFNHDGSILTAGGFEARIDIPVDDCSRNEGGPPTVADFDGDGLAEVAAAGADFYIVADLECLASPVPPQCSDFGIRWKVPNFDCSSRVTGSSVFDFDGDGRAEVIYNDEQHFRIFDGTTGAVLVEVDNRSHTRLEMPIVADVDNDGNAEIVFIENGTNHQGIRVWADALDSWVPTRRIWNQHSYHVTNVDEDGHIPISEEPNWLKVTTATESGFMNNFRQNLPDYSVFAAPDLTVELDIDRGSCPDYLSLVAEVCNRGLLQVGAGLELSFYDITTEQLLDSCLEGNPMLTSAPLVAGACVVMECRWAPPPESPQTVEVRACVDNPGFDCVPVSLGAGGAGGGAGAGGAAAVDNGGNNECKEDNNLSDDSALGCDVVPP